MVDLGANEWVYVSEYIELGEIKCSGSFMQFEGDSPYYQSPKYDEGLMSVTVHGSYIGRVTYHLLFCTVEI